MAAAVLGLLFGGIQFFLLYRITGGLLQKHGRIWPFAAAKLLLYTAAGLLLLGVFQTALMSFGIGMGTGMIAAAFAFFCWTSYGRNRGGKGRGG